MMDNLNRGKVTASVVYSTYCVSCHQANGKGDGNRFPPVAASEWVNGDKTKLISVILNGLQGPVTIKGLSYNEVMPAHGRFLNNEQVAEVLTYIKSNFGNTPETVTPKEVEAVRKATTKP